MALLFGAAVSVTGIYLVLKRWFTKRNFCNKLLSIHRDYTDRVSESKRIVYSYRMDKAQ